ncbi:MAG TPA: EscU/YscU/HrcU family type III secretion system export apparatus switch protein [Microthrixaceae bacterium]|nr:EscU/YscU/HrcU family type III secretion system export apparatus switch protein [Microthrixaceae bacterium]
MGEDKSQKTEAPTPKRKKEMRKKGQVAKSATLVSWISLLVATYLIPMVGSNIGELLSEGIRSISAVAATPEPETLLEISSTLLKQSAMALAPLLLGAALLGLVGNLAQVGFIFTMGPLTPKFERISPLAGVKRLFSVKSLWEVGKQILTMGVILAVAIPGVIGIINSMMGSTWALGPALSELMSSIMSLVQLVAAVGCLIGGADFAWQRFSLKRDSRMTKQEIKREARESEGDPHLKAKLRSNQMAMGRNRMLAAVGTADVIITNPTHFAVALSYDPTKGAPRVVARGADSMAAKIREHAAAANVPMVESPPLARVLFRSCRVDDEIPAPLFQAVATVLAFVRRVERRAASGRMIELSLPDTWTPAGEDPETSLTQTRRRTPPRRRRKPTQHTPATSQ